MISTEYILLDPEFKPTQSVDRAAGFDLKAYLPEAAPFNWDSFKFSEGTRFYLNGKLIEGPLYSNDILNKVQADRRFAVIEPGAVQIISAGFKISLSTNNRKKIAAMLILPRSGLACKSLLTVINSPGLVDENYPDTVGIGLINHTPYVHLIGHGARIAQAMFVEVEHPKESVVEKFTISGQRTGGFGTTGV